MVVIMMMAQIGDAAAADRAGQGGSTLEIGAAAIECQREQAPGEGQIAIGRQAAGCEAGRIGEQAGPARQGITVEGRRLGRGGAEHIKQPTPEAQARGRAEGEGLNIAETGAAAQADAAGGEPEEVGGAAQLDGLVDHRAQRIHHPHHQVAVALGLEQHATDGAAGVEGGEAVEQVAAGAGAAATDTGVPCVRGADRP